ncbi:MAG: Putative ABC transporter arginine-binding protein 2 [Candidatus Celerinatantimonas neptuna]|nr:MAG: Putative ABC transporter arginine-binding protein 2 [Candidatus Celerinatantimonas neptuna]
MRLFRLGTVMLLLISSYSFAGGVIRFATEASYPPFESINKDHQFVGFDIDLARAICSKMNKHCVFSHQPFDSLLASIEFGRYDAAISALDITPDRLKQVAFSRPYLFNGAVFLVHKNRFEHQRDLYRGVIAVQNGSTQQKYLLDRFVERGATVVPYASYQMALNDLAHHKVDSVFVDQAVAMDWLKKHPSFTILGWDIVNKKYFGDGLGIAVRKGNKQLVRQINSALKSIKASGVYQKIYQKYFVAGVSISQS